MLRTLEWNTVEYVRIRHKMKHVYARAFGRTSCTLTSMLAFNELLGFDRRWIQWRH